jgi:hypothetical protein
MKDGTRLARLGLPPLEAGSNLRVTRLDPCLDLFGSVSSLHLEVKSKLVLVDSAVSKRDRRVELAAQPVQTGS